MIAHVPATTDPGTADPGMSHPGTAELQLGIVMTDPGAIKLQLGIHHATTVPTTPEPRRRRAKHDSTHHRGIR